MSILGWSFLDPVGQAVITTIETVISLVGDHVPVVSVGRAGRDMGHAGRHPSVGSTPP